MYPLRACGHYSPTHSLRTSSRYIRLGSGLFHTTLKATPSCSHTRNLPPLSRPASTSRQVPRGASNTFTYPPTLNVFNSGTPPTLAIGFTRLASWFALSYGVYISFHVPWLYIPGIIPLALAPLLLSGLAFGGYVNHINVHLPNSARATKQTLQSFAKRVPRDTRFEIKCMWFMPWPKTKVVYFDDLRRLPFSNVRLANLEHIPLAQRRAHEESGWKGWLARVFLGRYWVSRQQVKDRSRAPGVWNTMWEQIPVEGSEGVRREVRGQGRVPYAITNRPRASTPAKPR